jgi:hypothetical protein
MIRISNKIKNSVCLILLFLLVFWWFYPGILKGAANDRIIAHFSYDDGAIIFFYGDFYKEVFSTPPAIVAYPTAYYYLSGSFLFPYSAYLKNSNNHHAIAITLRIVNLISILLTITVAFFLFLYFLKSSFMTFLLLLFILTTPEYLYWGHHLRPHILEILLLFISLTFALVWIKNRKIRYIIISLIFAALAFATKYGGLFIAPVLFIFFLFHYLQMGEIKLSIFLGKNFKLINFLSFLVISLGIGLIVTVHHYFIPLAVKITQIGRSLGEQGLRNLKLFQFITIVLFFIALIGALWSFLNFYSNKIGKKIIKNYQINKAERLALICNFGFLSVLVLILLFAAIFIIANPHCIVHPIDTARAFFGIGLIEFSFSKEGEGFLKELLSNLVWFKMPFRNNILGKSAVFLLIFYLISEIANFKRKWKHDRTHMIQIIFVWSYIISTLVFLFCFIRFHGDHYLLMTSFLLSFLIFYGICESIRLERDERRKIILIILAAILLIFNFRGKIPQFLEIREYYNNKDKDAGLYIGDWISESYDENIKIWMDTKEFYVPPKFKNISSIWWHENIEEELDKIESIKPDLLIITCEFDASLNNVAKIKKAIAEEKLPKYKLVKTFKYYGPLKLSKSESRSKYKEINIFQKNEI